MQHIRFEDGEAYDRGMSPWSRLAGEMFLSWLAPRPALRWLDVGCGTGAFAELIAERCAPTHVVGVDPSEGQLAFARARSGASNASYEKGDAMALPFGQHQFDAAVMALVIFFVPEPAKGVAEMARVVRPGGWVGAYAWDVLGGGFPFDSIWQETLAAGVAPFLPPKPELGRLEVLHALWKADGLQEVEAREIVVTRTFPSFEDYWITSTITGGVRPKLDAMSNEARAALKERVRARLPVDSIGCVTWTARASAVKGRVAVEATSAFGPLLT
jgi:ubiquinone/menaquinone biosynthesis C-methylase UbiE